MDLTDDAENILQDPTDDAKSILLDPADDAEVIRNGHGMSFPINARVKVSQSFRLGGPMITLMVGTANEAVPIQVHQDILTRSSEFFARALKPQWADMRERPDRIELPAHLLKDVETYAHWLYSGKIPARCFNLRQNFEDEESNPIWVDLASAYAFDEQILDRKYQRTILETMANVQNDSQEAVSRRYGSVYPSEVALRILYDGTPESSPIRELIADTCAYAINHDEVRKPDFNLLPREALVDVLEAMQRMKSSPEERPWEIDTESYAAGM